MIFLLLLIDLTTDVSGKFVFIFTNYHVHNERRKKMKEQKIFSSQNKRFSASYKPDAHTNSTNEFNMIRRRETFFFDCSLFVRFQFLFFFFLFSFFAECSEPRKIFISTICHDKWECGVGVVIPMKFFVFNQTEIDTFYLFIQMK